ncbi:hypothetical protein L1C40_25850 [Klebsiella pneumoniae]|uniref:hypothetical protein n=1 Tax=Klebsiella pneumoniae TaxID=573 RepID=UPI0020CC4764|nr:hypothetical protein [Klebsiella pneumoniae]MCQ0572257.1 hypothetical protein [Klebsiella pneumoniae]
MNKLQPCEVTLTLPAGGRWIVDTRDGAATYRRLNDDDHIATLASFMELAKLAGFIVADPAEGQHA